MLAALGDAHWQGQANVLDRRHLYEWPAIDEVAAATRKPPTDETAWTPPASPPIETTQTEEPAAQLIRRRRSTQAYDGSGVISADILFSMLDRLLPRPGVAPWDALHHLPRIHPVLFVHRVDGLAPGLYALPRRPDALALLREAMRDEFLWQKTEDCPEHLPLFHLLRADARNAARTVSCHQDIAGNAAFSLGMLAELEGQVSAAPWSYRHLYWEAGMLGQVLYLDAEAHGLRGTGIGCFFDDLFHEILGIQDERLQSLYHFAVGHPLTDNRLITLPPYHHLPAQRHAP
ncbi:MAG: nitroreductase family protein [Acidihalobacter sp.]